jgi:hypothetical protein
MKYIETLIALEERLTASLHEMVEEAVKQKPDRAKYLYPLERLVSKCTREAIASYYLRRP